MLEIHPNKVSVSALFQVAVREDGADGGVPEHIEYRAPHNTRSERGHCLPKMHFAQFFAHSLVFAREGYEGQFHVDMTVKMDQSLTSRGHALNRRSESFKASSPAFLRQS
jgi:hypothetical protein